MNVPPKPNIPSKVYALRDNKIQEVDDDEVDAELVSPNNIFSTHINLIPMHSAVQAPRLFYGARFYNQALPLLKSESALVRNLVDNDPDGETFDDKIGRASGAIFADTEAEVTDVQPDYLDLLNTDGTKRRINLYNNFNFNRKSAINQTPMVKVGDRVLPKQILAKSNYTDDKGALALGLNARVGLVPYKGFSMDDAIVVSESFAKRLTSDHATAYEQDFDKDTKGGLNHYISLFPTQFKKSQIAKLDDKGVVKPGMIVEEGDPLVLATRPRVFSSTTSQLGKLSKAMRQSRHDSSQLWDNPYPGTVTDVAKTKTGYKVIVRANAPAQLGDKIVFRPGQKSLHVDTEVFTTRGWIKIPDILQTDTVAALFDDSPCHPFTGKNSRPTQQCVARFVKPLDAHSYHFEGELYGLASARAAYLVTGNHRIWSAAHNILKDMRWSCHDAAEIEGSPRTLMTAAPFDLSTRADPETFTISPAYHSKTGVLMSGPISFKWDTWVKFLAIYLSEGNIHHNRPDHTIIITQKEKPFCRVIEQVLTDMGIGWHRSNLQYVTNPNKALRIYLEQFGKAANKFIPEYIINGTQHTLDLFRKTIWQCDGDKDVGKCFYSSSPQMISGMSRILTQLGVSVSEHWRQARSHQNHDSCELQVYEQPTTSTKKDYKDAFFREQYKGQVYCLQVPGLGVILTRFRGKIMWIGNSIISKILPDEQMPRTKDGKPLEVLLNELGIPSRVNNSMIYELLLGKVAAHTGKPITMNTFTKKGEKWYDLVAKHLQDNNLPDVEEVYDPLENKMLENPITVGVGHILKLHHTSASKKSSRGQGSYSCFDARTEVFTDRGWVPWPEVTDEDTLLDPQPTAPGVLSGDFVKPLNITRQLYNGDMLTYTSKYLDWCVTPNHKFYIKRKLKTPELVVTADKLCTVSKCTIPCTAIWNGGNYTAYKVLPGVPQTRQRYGKLWVDDLRVKFSDYVEFAAWYIAEGSHQGGNGRHRVYIWQNIQANPDNCAQIQNLLNRLNIKWYAAKRHGVVVGYAFNDSRWFNLVKEWGDYAWTKTIPSDILMSDLTNRQLFIDTYIKGDGRHNVQTKTINNHTYVGTTKSITTASSAVATAIDFLLTSIGLVASTRATAVGTMTCPTTAKVYQRRSFIDIGIHLKRSVASIIPTTTDARYDGVWKTVHYNGTVYCATMPHGRLLVRRNGKTYITGNSDEQPLKGGGEAGGAKRLSGLESHSLLSAGAYKTLKEGATLRGQKNDEYWRALRQGYTPKQPGSPFVWDKFQALLVGAGMHARKIPGGKLRLGPFTDDDLNSRDAMEVKSGELVDINTMEPTPGGLFDQGLVGNNRWGKISLPFAIPNPAFQPAIQALLGLTEKELRSIIAGDMELPEHLLKMK